MGDFVATAARVRAPATSANLGPGFDSFALALDLCDVVEGRVAGNGLSVQVTGEAADAVPVDESHLVVKAVRAGFDTLGVAQPGLRLTCRNVIPHGRGLGSSAAAIVSGIRLADALLGGGVLAEDDALALATELEGHPDNVAACLSGGFTIAWRDACGPRAVRLPVHADHRLALFIPPLALATAIARGLLPAEVSHRAASANAGRAALLVAAMTTRPDLLLAATQDALHQEFRRAAMPDSLALVEALRASGVAAVISGAGPSVLALGAAGDPVDVVRWTPRGWLGSEPEIAASGASAF